uniref:Uncharacterized protein n=2 Tax=unclassified Rosemountvirus TaxID=2738372 RepID=A0AAU8GFJ8_9CAUD
MTKRYRSLTIWIHVLFLCEVISTVTIRWFNSHD